MRSERKQRMLFATAHAFCWLFALLCFAVSQVDLFDPQMPSTAFVGLTNPHAFTLASWLRMFRLGGGVDVVFFSSFPAAPLSTSEQMVFGFSASAQLMISVQRAGATLCSAHATTAAQTNTWMHIAATFSSLQGCTVFLNGQPVASSPIDSSVATPLFMVSALRTVYLLGSDGSGTPTIHAEIATFGLWNRALEIGEIRLMGSNLPQQIVPPSSPAPTVALRYAAQKDVLRSAMFQYRATSAVPLTVSGTPINLAATDPTTGRGLYASPVPTWIEPGNFSASVWVSFNRLAVLEPLLFVSSSALPVPFSFHLRITRDGGNRPVPTFSAVQPGVGSSCDVTAEGIYAMLEVNVWAHLAVTFSVVPEMGPPTGASALVQCAIYFNGKRVALTEHQNYDATVLPTGMGGSRIGVDPGCTSCPFPTMDGFVAAFNVFNRVLSGREVSTLYNSPPPPVLGSNDLAPAPRSVSSDIYSSAVYFLPMDSPLNPARAGFVASTEQLPGVPAFQGDVTTGVAVFGATAVGSYKAFGWIDLADATHVSPLRLFPTQLTTAEVTVSLWVNVQAPATAGFAPCFFDHGIKDAGTTPLKTTHAIRLALESTVSDSWVSFALTRCGATPATDCIFVCDPAVMRAQLRPGAMVDWKLITATLDSQGYCSLYLQGMLQVRARAAQANNAALVRGLLQFGQTPQRTSAFLGACAAGTVASNIMTDVRMSHFGFWSRALSMREVGVLWRDPPFFVRRQLYPMEALRDSFFVPAPAASWALEEKFFSSALMLQTEAAASGVPFAVLGGANPFLRLMQPMDNAPTMTVLPRVGIPGESSTLSMWLQFPALPGSADILACARGSPASDLISIKISNSRLIVTHSVEQVAVPSIVTGVGTVAAGQWFLLSLVLDFVAQATRLHYNSALIGFQAWGRHMAPALVLRGACNIAADESGATSASPTHVAGIKFFRAALSTPQLLRLFNSPPGAIAPILQRDSFSQIPVARRSSAYALSFVNTGGVCPVHMNCDVGQEVGVPSPVSPSLDFNDPADHVSRDVRISGMSE